MADQFIDLSRVIDVTIQGASIGLGAININTVALLSRETPSWSDEYRIYTNPTEVGVDFGTGSKAYAIAVAFFSQQPNVLTTGGYLAIIPFLNNISVAASRVIQNLTYTAVTTGAGGNAITIEYTAGGTKGAEAVTVVGNAISVQIAVGLSINAEIKAAIAASAPATALVTTAFVAGFETATAVAVAATNLQGGSAAGAETVPANLTRTAGDVYYFGVLLDEEISGATLALAAASVQSLDKLLFYASSAASDYAPGGMLDLLRSGSLSHTRGLYYHTTTPLDTQRFAAAYAGRGLSTDFGGSRTTQTLHLKSLAGIIPDATVNATALTAAVLAGVDTYVSIQGVPSLFTSGRNVFFDEIYNEFWLKFAVQVAIFNVLKQTGTKVPQTESGLESLKNEVRLVLDQGVGNGFIGPGAWNSPTVFGNPADLIRCVADSGYYVYSRPIALQLQADRDLRKAPLIQVAAKAQGAVHSASIQININQ